MIKNVTVGFVTLVHRVGDAERLTICPETRAKNVVNLPADPLEYALPGGGALIPRSSEEKHIDEVIAKAERRARKINDDLRNGICPRIVSLADGTPYTKEIALQLMTGERGHD